MASSSVRVDSTSSEPWRFPGDGHAGPRSGHLNNAPSSGGRLRPAAGKVDSYTQGLIDRVAKVCEGYKPTPLALRLNLHPETVRRYINGQRPSPEFLAALCRELGVAPDWLLLGEGEMYRPGHA